MASRKRKPWHGLFGRRLRSLREESGLEVPQLADAAGLSNHRIWSYEGSYGAPVFSKLFALAAAFKIDEAALFIWPGVHVRHDCWELVRLAPDEALPAIKVAIEEAIAQVTHTTEGADVRRLRSR